MDDGNTSHYIDEAFKLVMGGVERATIYKIIMGWGFTANKADTIIRWATVKAKKLRWI